MPKLKDCLVKARLGDDISEYIQSQSLSYQQAGMTEQQADIRAIQELQEDTLDSLQDIYNQLGIEGYDAVDNTVEEVIPEKVLSSPNEQQTRQTEGTEQAEGDQAAKRSDRPDVIASRSRSQSEQDASRQAAKEKISSPDNASLKAANSYNSSVGLPEITPHTLVKADPEFQGKIAKAYPQLQDVTRPDYKETEQEREIFEGYKSKFPKIISQYEITSYKDLVEKAYAQLASETDKQFKSLPVTVEFHDGDKNYDSSAEMMDDVHNFNHLWVFRGGEDHTLLGSKTVDKDGLTANDKFRAVHDYFGHSVAGHQFGKDGERNAWIEHSKMFSPLAQLALSSETNGQNSFVNFSGVNEVQLEKLKVGAALKNKGREENNQGMIDEGQQLIEEANSEFTYAEQKSIVLPVEYSNVSQWVNQSDEVPKKLDIHKATMSQQRKSFEQKVDDIADKLINILSAKLPEGTKKSGLGAEEIVRAGASVIKSAYRIEKNIEKAIAKGLEKMRQLWKESFGDNIPFPEEEVTKQLNKQFGIKDTVSDEVKAVADEVRAGNITMEEATDDKPQSFIDDLNKELFGSKRFSFDEQSFKNAVRRQKEVGGFTKDEIITNFSSSKNLTKRQLELIDEVFFESFETDQAVRDLKEALGAISAGERPKSVLKRLAVSNVTSLVKTLSDTLTYRTLTNKQSEDIADYIVDVMDIDYAQEYLDSMRDNNLASVKPLVRAKLALKLKDEGRLDEASQMLKELADEAVTSGQQSQIHKRVYELLGAKGSPAMKTRFAELYTKKVNEVALKKNRRMAEVISDKDAEIGRLNDIIHKAAQKTNGFQKLKDVIAKLCRTRLKGK